MFLFLQLFYLQTEDSLTVPTTSVHPVHQKISQFCGKQCSGQKGVGSAKHQMFLMPNLTNEHFMD